MASSSSNHLVKYDAFLSFRGADTRNNFTSHLYAALRRQGIVTFIDNRLERGEEIEPAILKAIEESDVSVVILSKDYASSQWCLDELVKIFECRDKQGQKHRQLVNRVEPELIEVVVKEVLKYLRYDLSYGFKNLVGIHSRVSQIESLLCIGPNNVRIIGIWGMGGIGKTAIAKVVYGKYASQFEGSCFLENVRDHNLPQLREKLLSQLLSEGDTNSRLLFGMRQLRYKKLLIVLDNVDDYEQIKLLAQEHNWFGEGSRIIITSRDKSVFQDRVDGIYEVEGLSDQEALRLFILCAFKEDHPGRDCLELSNKVVSYAGGNPLALEVLGLFLYGKNKEEWGSALKKLERFPDKKIQNILRISYDGLDSLCQQIFLDIVLMFKGEPMSRVIDLLDACGFSTLIGVRELADKSLIIISNGVVDIHDLLQEMGRQIICQESQEPEIRSRLGNPEDIYHVLTKNTGNGATKRICLDTSKLEKPLSLHPRVFANMNGIQLFKFHNFGNNVDEAWSFEEVGGVPNNLLIHEGLKNLPNELRLLHWQFYSEKSLPSNFRPEKLVEINLSGSCVKRLWKGVQDLPNLKEIKLRLCRQLLEMPNFSGAPKLEKIDCTGCVILVEVCPSISYLNNLYGLYLTNCYKIKSIPNTKCLKYLWVGNCSIKKFPQVSITIEDLRLGGTEIEEIPACSIQFLSQLKALSLIRCKKLKNVPSFVFKLIHLEYLVCGPYLNPFPVENNSTSLFTSLRRLYLYESELERIPSSIQQMSSLVELHLISSRRLLSLPQLPLHLQCLDATDCKSLVQVSKSLISLQEYWGQLIFADCTNLNEIEIRNIVIHAKLRILVLAHAPPPPPPQGYIFKSRDSREQFVAIFPGNNIPNWIGHQRRGFSITIPLPLNWFHNFLGFAVANVFEFGKCADSKRMQVEIQFKSNSCEETSCYCIPTSFFDYGDCLTVSPGEQVLLWYHKEFSLKDKYQDSMSCYNEVVFKFFIVDEYNKPLPCSMIKKCGVRVLYKGDEDAQSALKLDDDNFEDYWNYVDNDEPSTTADTFSFHHPNDKKPELKVEVESIPMMKMTRGRIKLSIMRKVKSIHTRGHIKLSSMREILNSAEHLLDRLIFLLSKCFKMRRED